MSSNISRHNSFHGTTSERGPFRLTNTRGLYQAVAHDLTQLKAQSNGISSVVLTARKAGILTKGFFEGIGCFSYDVGASIGRAVIQVGKAGFQVPKKIQQAASLALLKQTKSIEKFQAHFGYNPFLNSLNPHSPSDVEAVFDVMNFETRKFIPLSEMLKKLNTYLEKTRQGSTEYRTKLNQVLSALAFMYIDAVRECDEDLLEQFDSIQNLFRELPFVKQMSSVQENVFVKGKGPDACAKALHDLYKRALIEGLFNSPENFVNLFSEETGNEEGLQFIVRIVKKQLLTTEVLNSLVDTLSDQVFEKRYEQETALKRIELLKPVIGDSRTQTLKGTLTTRITQKEEAKALKRKEQAEQVADEYLEALATHSSKLSGIDSKLDQLLGKFNSSLKINQETKDLNLEQLVDLYMAADKEIQELSRSNESITQEKNLQNFVIQNGWDFNIVDRKDVIEEGHGALSQLQERIKGKIQDINSRLQAAQSQLSCFRTGIEKNLEKDLQEQDAENKRIVEAERDLATRKQAHVVKADKLMALHSTYETGGRSSAVPRQVTRTLSDVSDAGQASSSRP